jgi:hypothetical protein
MHGEPGGVVVVVVGSRRNLRSGRFVRHVSVAIAIKSEHVPPHSLCLHTSISNCAPTFFFFRFFF